MALLRRAARGGAAQLAALATPVAAFSGPPTTFQALGATSLPSPQRRTPDMLRARVMHPAMLCQRDMSSASTGAAAEGPLALYRERVESGMYRADARQVRLAPGLHCRRSRLLESRQSPIPRSVPEAVRAATRTLRLRLGGWEQEAAVEKLQRLHDEITDYVDSPWQPGMAFESVRPCCVGSLSADGGGVWRHGVVKLD